MNRSRRLHRLKPLPCLAKQKNGSDCSHPFLCLRLLPVHVCSILLHRPPIQRLPGKSFYILPRIAAELQACHQRWSGIKSQLEQVAALEARVKELEGENTKLVQKQSTEAKCLMKTSEDQAKLRQEVEEKSKVIAVLEKKFKATVDLDKCIAELEAKKTELLAQKTNLEAENSSLVLEKTKLEEELLQGVNTGVMHALAPMKSNFPELNLDVLHQGYNCETQEEIDALADQVSPTADAFIEKLGLHG